jgi:glyoxylase-like metal-dependent hydrolase (beta-lactamase superfamily II)
MLLMKGGIMASNVYLIENGNRSILIDTSTQMYTETILQRIRETGLKYTDISLIIITHCHFDHCSGLSNLKEHLVNAKVLIHEEEEELLSKGDFKMPGGRNWMGKVFSCLGKVIKELLKYDPV